jgi:hypothetical protein
LRSEWAGTKPRASSGTTVRARVVGMGHEGQDLWGGCDLPPYHSETRGARWSRLRQPQGGVQLIRSGHLHQGEEAHLRDVGSVEYWNRAVAVAPSGLTVPCSVAWVPELARTAAPVPTRGAAGIRRSSSTSTTGRQRAPGALREPSGARRVVRANNERSHARLVTSVSSVGVPSGLPSRPSFLQPTIAGKVAPTFFWIPSHGGRAEPARNGASLRSATAPALGGVGLVRGLLGGTTSPAALLDPLPPLEDAPRGSDGRCFRFVSLQNSAAGWSLMNSSPVSTERGRSAPAPLPRRGRPASRPTSLGNIDRREPCSADRRPKKSATWRGETRWSS